MANYVSSHLQFHGLTEEGSQKLKSIVDLMESRSSDKSEQHLALAFFEDLASAPLDINWMCENVGAKWAYLTEFDGDSLHFNSAWSPVFEFVSYLVGEISKSQENFMATYSYEDEFYNFAGVSVYDQDGIYESVESDFECLQEEVFIRYPDIREQWDEEEEEWRDQGDAFYDVFYEHVSDWQYNLEKDLLQELKEAE